MVRDKSISILYLEDDDLDVDIIRHTIAEGNFKFNLTHVKNKYEFKTALRTMKYNVILADHHLPDIDCYGVLSIVKNMAETIPVIILAGSYDEEEVISSLQFGAKDYIFKDKLHKLLPSLEKVIDNVKKEHKVQRLFDDIKLSEQRLTTIFNEIIDIVIVFDIENGKILKVNNSIKKILGYKISKIKGNDLFSLFYRSSDITKEEYLQRLKLYGYILEDIEFLNINDNPIKLESIVKLIPWDEGKAGFAVLKAK